ncbi:MAG: hypothetical protein HZB57_02675 [Gammaproteobacteria bacterium]|nr:hypothetical protein [Gammaproteobacteria bacterium]
MPKDYGYGFEFEENGGRKIIRYRQDKLGFSTGFAWYIFFQLIAYFFLGGEDGSYTYVLPFVALGVLAYRRSRMREISVGESDITIKGKHYDRAKITKIFVENNNVRQTFSSQPQNYDQIARDAELNPLGGDPVLAKAGAMAGDLTKSFAMMVAAGIDATGKKAQMIYDGKNIVVAKWLSVQRAMMLSNALGSRLGFKMDEKTS